MDVSLKELSEELDEFSISPDDKILQKMKHLCEILNYNPQDMVATWVAFATTKRCDMEPTLEYLKLLEIEELAKAEIKTPKRNLSRACSTVYNARTIEMLDDSDGLYATPIKVTPGNSKTKMLNGFVKNPSLPFSPSSFSPVIATPSAKYGSRNKSGEVVCSYGTGSVQWKCVDNFSCNIAPFDKDSALLEQYKYMFEKLRDHASVLNDMIEEKALQFQKKYNISEWAHVCLPAMDQVSVIGRICSESTEKLSSTSIYLEGSQESSSGQIVSLDISALPEFSFFPGQIVAGIGINNQGKKFALKELYENILPSFPPNSPSFEDLVESLDVVVATGPFTTSDTLSYEPLGDLVKYLKEYKPHACILCGPFVDIRHTDIERGNLSETYSDIFRRIVSNTVSSLEGIHTKVILVPNMHDAHHEFVYPTPPYKSEQIKNVYLASDPCILNINGVIFGITSTDILFHMGKEEISFSPQTSDRLGRLCGHLLMQRNFYPLYPCNEDTNIDYIHAELHATIPVVPHIMILPSDLRYFIKDINGCCCINPERLTKRYVGGTFARLKIKSFNEEMYTGSIVDHIVAEIVKI